MTADPKIAVEPGLVAPAAQPPSPGVRAGAVVLIGTWFGLIAGFADTGFLVMNRRLIDHDFYHVGADFPWIVPLGVLVLVVAPAFFIALFARIRGPISPGVPVMVLSFLAFLELCARLRLHMWAAVIVSTGLANQSVRLLRPRLPGFLGLVRRSVGLLVAIFVATTIFTTGQRVWSEYRQQANLPPPPAGAERAVDRLGHGADRQHELTWVPPAYDTKSPSAGEPRRAVRPGIRGGVVDVAFTREHAYRTMAS